MTDATISRSTPVRQQPAKGAPQRTQPLAEDVRAMADAFARARGEARPPVGQLLQQGGKLPGEKKPATPMAQTASDFRAELAQAAGLRAADERGALDRREAEKGGEQALGLVSPNQAAPQGAAPLPAPAPHVDPSGFAQMLADLWTRENGRGDKHVQVKFGAQAWPATGAELVQSADGLLDVTVDLAAGGPRVSTDALTEGLAGAGLRIGRVALA
jgi:hypothetical protein